MSNPFPICLLLVAVGMSLRMSLKLLYGARGPRSEDPIFQILNVLGWGLILFPTALLIIVGTNLISIILGMIALSTLVEAVIARREMQRRAVWALLSANREGQYPEPETLRRHQSRFTGIVGRAFRRLCDSLESGVDVRMAVAKNAKALPREAQAFAAIDALEAGTLPLAYGADAPARAAPPPAEVILNWQALSRRGSYVISIILMMLGIVTFVLIRIVPSFQAIFDDFDLDLPKVTIDLIRAANLASNALLAPLISLLILAFLLAAFAAAILYICDVPVLRPLLDRVFFGFHRTLILRLLAITAEKRQSMANNVKQLMCGVPAYPSGYVRKRLDRVHRLMHSGNDWKEALAKTALIKRADIPLLASSESAGNLAWVLRLLADQKTRLLLSRWTIYEQLAFPMVIVLLGLFVAFFCIAMFVPLVSLIEGLI